LLVYYLGLQNQILEMVIAIIRRGLISNVDDKPSTLLTQKGGHASK
jgi:hypothetical protein